MTASDNLRAERLRRTHEKFLEASEKYPTLCHLAIDAATAVSFLDERPRFLDESNQEDPGYDFSITLDLREGMLSKKSYVETVPTLLGIDSDMLNVFPYISGPKLIKEDYHAGTGRICRRSYRRNHAGRRPSAGQIGRTEPQLRATTMSLVRSELLPTSHRAANVA